MKMVEIAYASEIKQLEKLQAQLERREKALEKKMATAEKLGVNWTNDEHRAWLENEVETMNGFIVKKEDIKKNSAWFDVIRAKSDLEETQRAIEKANARLEKKQKAVEEYREEVAKIENLKEREKLMKLDFEKEQKEWLKDGIKLEGRYYGETPNGKRFAIDRNRGVTERSLHCFTLYIDGETVFTSGEFWRAYMIIKNN